MKTLQHAYEPHGAALDLLHCRAPEVLLSGPAGTGKSRACLEKLHLLMMLNPGSRGLMVRKTQESLKSSGLVTYREHVAKEAIEAGDVQWYGGSAQEAAQYRYTNGSTITIGGMDKPTKIMSTEYDAVYVQEAIELTVTDWENITTRLRNGKISFQQLLADTNPSHPNHWLKQRCDRGDTVLMESRHEDNPTLFRNGALTPAGTAYIGTLDRLTGVRYQRLRKGLWVAAEGLVYETFDPAIHMRSKFTDGPPDSWPRYWTIDFGFTNPFVAQFWAEDPDGRLYLYREIYKTRTLVEDHARQILKLVTRPDGTWKEPKPRAVICDHDAEGRATLSQHLGLGTVPAVKAVTEGIQAVESRMAVQPDGRPRIFLCHDALFERDPLLADSRLPMGAAEEISGYVWDLKDGRVPKEVPVKENDHSMDAMRYVVAYRDLGAVPRVRFL